MVLFPKTRGFWDYALFASILAVLLICLFGLEAGNRVGWADAMLALAAAILSVFVIVLARKSEKATWVVRPTRRARALTAFGALSLIFGALCMDAYFFHRRDLTAARFNRDAALGLAWLLGLVLSLGKRTGSGRQPQ
jgi:hypothetical protein